MTTSLPSKELSAEAHVCDVCRAMTGRLVGQSVEEETRQSQLYWFMYHGTILSYTRTKGS